MDGMGEAEGREQDEEVHLGDAELDMLALRREVPGEGGGNALLPEGVGQRLAGEEATPIDEGAEIGRDGHVRRAGDDALGEGLAAPGDLVEDEAEALLGRHGGLGRHRQPRRDGQLRRREAAAAARGEGHALEIGLELRLRHGEALEGLPFLPRPHVHGGAEGLHLRRRHQPRMVVLVALEGQAEALDRIGDEADGPVVVDALEGLEQRGHVVAGKVGHEPGQFGIRAPVEQRRHRALVADVVLQALPPGSAPW